MNNTKVHILIGNPDTGKTTTAWLIYLMLKEKGTVEYFRSFDDGSYEIKEPQEPKPEIHCFTNHCGEVKAWDFCALIIVKDIKIAVYSGGDNEDIMNIAFQWVGQIRPDYFVGCCRNHGKSSARKKLNEYMAQYDMTLHRVYCDYENADFKQAIEHRKTLATEIVGAIIANNKPSNHNIMNEKNQHKDRELTEMDKLYQEIYGEAFAKAGTAYERMATAAISYLMNYPALYNQFVKGYSGVEEQHDGNIITPEGEIMVEAKDYKSPIGYKHIAKQEGTLTDNDMKSGILVSHSGFSEPTIQYAKGTLTNPMQKSIILYDVRKSTDEDQKGRIAKIQINFNVSMLDFTLKCIRVDFTQEGLEQLSRNTIKKGQAEAHIRLHIEDFYDSKGNVINTIMQISTELNKYVDMNDESQIKIEGFYPLENHYIKYDNQLYPIKGLNYKIPVLRFTITDEIIGGEPVLLVKSSDGKYNKLITTEELQQFSFDNGKIIKKTNM